jgi:RecA/RadA recombinase
MVEKRFGKGAMMNMSDDAAKTVKVFSTGSLGLDAALGTGGLPFGRVSEIYGPESSGKTTLTLQAIAEVQKGGGGRGLHRRGARARRRIREGARSRRGPVADQSTGLRRAGAGVGRHARA